MCGQGAIEYFTIVAALIVVFAGVTITQMVNPFSESAREEEQLAQAQVASDTIANAINGVYANSEGAVITEFVNVSKSWSLDLNSDNLRVGVEIDGEMEWKESSLEYGFDNSIPNISSGNYTVIVEWPSDGTENINLDSANDKIYIYINPGGGG
ncbi:hypothetical protein AKJ42_01665 [candidate division MSBL1 archaeon SCGC-AAA261C02]|uniref:Uncharacterized protein n=1 Tax=candidate division MSBL1 archaeon SCGC-AAA261C02 TaxID=1698272 RepID=A0A133V0X9_9EURY|nr:hypothetical protein AKJ42_01665 [candidate division MSBL1 archaeon SCGC-AAA261C02]